MTLFDTHCHLDVAAFDEDRGAVLRAARAAGVRELLVPAIHRAGWEGLHALCTADPGLHPALGLHPMLIDRHRPEVDLPDLDAAVARLRPRAIGEIGLDFQMRDADRERQTALFEAQLEIAAAHRLPVVLHVRKAHDAALQILRRHTLPGGFCHAFNGSLQQADRYLEMGFRLGFGGRLTYPGARRLHALARALPLDALVLETDAPDMSGFAHRGRRNEPRWLPEVLETLAALRAEDAGTLAAATTASARQVLGLDDA